VFEKQKLGNLRLGPERKKLLMDQVWGVGGYRVPRGGVFLWVR